MSGKNYNKKYKDNLFRMIFKDKKELLELYNAVNGSSYTNYDELSITTLENAVYMHMKNDLSFLIYSEMNLYEHQSTFNPNMPLRGLLYISEIYSAYISVKGYDIYTGKLIRLPLPQYVIFYNGEKEAPERLELRLSDSFDNPLGKQACIECTAVQLNINNGHNRELMEKCRKLYEYSEFVHTVRKYRGEGQEWKQSIALAIDYCIEHNVLKEFLIKNRAEVCRMLLYEYDEALHMNNEKKISWEEGRLEGIAEQVVTSVENAMNVLSISLDEACRIIGTKIETYYEAKNAYDK